MTHASQRLRVFSSLSLQVFINDSAHVIHCKYMVVDDVTCVLGSFNIDDYSFDKNAEVG